MANPEFMEETLHHALVLNHVPVKLIASPPSKVTKSYSQTVVDVSTVTVLKANMDVWELLL